MGMGMVICGLLLQYSLVDPSQPANTAPPRGASAKVGIVLAMRMKKLELF